MIDILKFAASTLLSFLLLAGGVVLAGYAMHVVLFHLTGTNPVLN